MKAKMILLLAGVAIALVVAFAFRYQYIPASTDSRAFVYRVNRWTGDIQVISGLYIGPIYPRRQRQDSR